MVKFNNLRLAVGENVKFYTSVAKRLKLKVRSFWGLSHTFEKVTGEKLVEGVVPPILNKFKGNAQFIFLCNPQKVSVNVCLMKTLEKNCHKKSVFIA